MVRVMHAPLRGMKILVQIIRNDRGRGLQKRLVRSDLCLRKTT